jgi:hypothetical protein
MILAAMALSLAQSPDLGPCAAIDRPNPTRAQALAVVSCVNAQVARQMAPSLPSRVDELTTLIGVVARGTSLLYSMRIDRLREQLPSAEIARQERTVRNNVCGTPAMRSTIGYGGSYQYLWLDRQGRRIHAFAIASCPAAASR